MAGPTPGFKSTAVWKAARAVKRRLRPPGPVAGCVGTLAVDNAPAALEVGQDSAWHFTVTNTGPDAWPARGPGAVGLTLAWHTPAGDTFGPPTPVALPAPAYPGEPLVVTATLSAPAAVGDFTLVVSLDRPGDVPPARIGVPVVGRRAADIDYHSVYRTADLQDNHWWVVGGYYTRDEYEKSSRERHDMLAEHAGLNPDSRVLDIGCGTGQVGDSLCDTMSDRGAYFGTDIGAEAVAFCQARFTRHNFHFAQGTMTSVPFPTAAGPFDIAVFFSVFTHTFLDESVLLLAEAVRLLGPAGVVVADVITSPLVERGAGNRGEMTVNADHFLRLAAILGLSATVIGRWQWNPYAERLMLVLRRT